MTHAPLLAADEGQRKAYEAPGSLTAPADRQAHNPHHDQVMMLRVLKTDKGYDGCHQIMTSRVLKPETAFGSREEDKGYDECHQVRSSPPPACAAANPHPSFVQRWLPTSLPVVHADGYMQIAGCPRSSLGRPGEKVFFLMNPLLFLGLNWLPLATQGPHTYQEIHQAQNVIDLAFVPPNQVIDGTVVRCPTFNSNQIIF
ncbi:hypothetical protein BDZ97DRAFT_1917250 [Flammula alnicola]|nr:hypothetical protein BDZ97DRAFT_1917250 [Flammula alnicola]